MWRSLHIEIFARKNAYKHFWLHFWLWLQSKDLYSTQRTHHITIIIYLTQLNAGPEFHFGNFSLSQVFTLRKKLQCLQGYSPAVFKLYRGLWGAHFFLFFYKGGILCACDGLTKIHKSYKKRYNYIYIYIYISIFLDFVFFRFHFIDSFLMIKLNCIYQKACLIN